MSAFGTLLKTYRERASLSQNELGSRAGMSDSTISRMEGGERSPPKRRAQVLSLAETMRLNQEETDLLLAAAGFAPSAAPELAVHPRDEMLYRIACIAEGFALQSGVDDLSLDVIRIRFHQHTSRLFAIQELGILHLQPHTAQDLVLHGVFIAQEGDIDFTVLA